MERLLVLEDVELFDNLSPSALLELARRVDTELFTLGHCVASRRDNGDRIFAIVAGEVALESPSRELARLGAHEVFGELALYGQRYDVRAIASDDLVVLSLSRVDIYHAVGADEEAAHELLAEVTCRLRARQQLPLELASTW